MPFAGRRFAIPGALGAQEGGLVLLCAAFGIPPEQAIALSLVKRAADLVLGVPGLVGWQMLEWGRLMPNYSLGRAAYATVGQSWFAGTMILFWLSVMASLVGIAGCIYLVAAAILIGRSARNPAHPSARRVRTRGHRAQAAARRRAGTARQPRLVLPSGLSRPRSGRVRGAGSE